MLGSMGVHLWVLQKQEHWAQDVLTVLNHPAASFFHRGDVGQNIGNEVEHFTRSEVRKHSNQILKNSASCFRVRTKQMNLTGFLL